MKSVYFSVILDSVFCCFLYLLLSQVLFSYFFDNPISLTLAVTLTLVLTLFTVKVLFEKRKKKGLLSLDDKIKNQIVFNLHFMPKSKLTALFMQAYSNLNVKCEKKREGIYLTDKKTLVILKFGYQEVSKADVVKAFNLIKKDQTVEIYSDEFSLGVQDFAKRFVNVYLKDAVDAVKLLKDGNSLDQIKDLQVETTPQKPNFIKNVFNKKRAKTFFGFGIFFLLSSFIVPIKTYYVISGSIMLIFSLVCIFFGNRTTQN